MSEVVKLEKSLNKRFDQIDMRFSDVDKNIDDLTALMSGFADDVSKRFNQQDARFDRIEEQLRIQSEQYNHLVDTIDGFIKRIDDYETELAARDHKIERLERWVEQIATKTGVTLS